MLSSEIPLHYTPQSILSVDAAVMIKPYFCTSTQEKTIYSSVNTILLLSLGLLLLAHLSLHLTFLKPSVTTPNTLLENNPILKVLSLFISTNRRW